VIVEDGGGIARLQSLEPSDAVGITGHRIVVTPLPAGKRGFLGKVLVSDPDRSLRWDNRAIFIGRVPADTELLQKLGHSMPDAKIVIGMNTQCLVQLPGAVVEVLSGELLATELLPRPQTRRWEVVGL